MRHGKRLLPHERREYIVRTAIATASEIGLFNPNFRLVTVAAQAKCSVQLIRHYFGSLDGLRNAMIETGDVDMIAQAEAARYDIQ